jgi:drug/metabolite transporter (DMT)-like permease
MSITTSSGSLRKPGLRDVALVVLLGTLWGSTFLAIKLSVFEVGPMLLALLRVITALIPLWLYMIWCGGRFSSDRRDWAFLLAMSLLNTVIPFLLISWAGLHVDTGVAALIMGLGPLLTLFVTHVTTSDDRFSMNKLIGMLIGFSGLVLIIGTEALAGFSENLLGDIAMIGVISCYVCATAMVRKIRSASKESIATTNMLISVVILAPIVFIFDDPSLDGLTLTGVFAILYLGIVVTGAGYLMRYHMVLTVGQSFMAMGSYIMPIVGVTLGAVFLDEPLSATVLVALALVLTGFAVARIRK